MCVYVCAYVRVYVRVCVNERGGVSTVPVCRHTSQKRACVCQCTPTAALPLHLRCDRPQRPRRPAHLGLLPTHAADAGAASASRARRVRLCHENLVDDLAGSVGLVHHSHDLIQQGLALRGQGGWEEGLWPVRMRKKRMCAVVCVWGGASFSRVAEGGQARASMRRPTWSGHLRRSSGCAPGAPCIHRQFASLIPPLGCKSKGAGVHPTHLW
jgi:hypothetical protein